MINGGVCTTTEELSNKLIWIKIIYENRLYNARMFLSGIATAFVKKNFQSIPYYNEDRLTKE